jgi:hypothetical protein
MTTFGVTPSTLALLDFEGTNGSTTFVDSGPNSLVVQSIGNIAISTERSIIGSSSARNSDISNEVLTFELPQPLGTSDYTIEFFYYLDIQEGQTYFGNFFGIGEYETYFSYAFAENGPNSLYLFSFYGQNTGYETNNLDTGVADPDRPYLRLNEWNHGAVCRNGNSLYVLGNGIRLAELDASQENLQSATISVFNASPEGFDVVHGGFIDGLRISSEALYVTPTYDIPGDAPKPPPTTVVAPTARISTSAISPLPVVACILNPPAPEVDTSEVIPLPVPPGVNAGNLPVIDSTTQIIDTSPSSIIGCTNSLQLGNEQEVLDLLFPSAQDLEGVINRQNNEVWRLEGGTWVNVGTSPGRTVVNVVVLPPWDEEFFVSSAIRIGAAVDIFDYSLEEMTLDIDSQLRLVSTVVNVTLVALDTTYVEASVGQVLQASILRARVYGIIESVEYDGNGGEQDISLRSRSTPSSIVFKRKTTTGDYYQFDLTRDLDYSWVWNRSLAEARLENSVLEYGDSGFTVGAALSESGFGYLAWALASVGGPFQDTSGDIPSEVRRGKHHSIVRYTGNGLPAQTVGHGLARRPSLIIAKSLDRNEAGRVGQSLFATRFYWLLGSSSGAIFGQDTLVSDTSRMTLETFGGVNYAGERHIAYCFEDAPGLLSTGSYDGHNSSLGPITVNVGFRPTTVIIKRVSGTGSWRILDGLYESTKRREARILTNFGYMQSANDTYEFHENGFRILVSSTLGDTMFAQGQTFVYWAFGSIPQTVRVPSVIVTASPGTPRAAGGTSSALASPITSWARGRAPVYVGQSATLVIAKTTRVVAEAVWPTVSTGASPALNSITASVSKSLRGFDVSPSTYRNNTTLLLPFSEVASSMTVKDFSPLNALFDTTPGVVLQEEITKFNRSALELFATPGGHSSISAPLGYPVNNGLFCIEAWVYQRKIPNPPGQGQNIIGCMPPGADWITPKPWSLLVGPQFSSVLRYYFRCRTVVGGVFTSRELESSNISYDSWAHCAVIMIDDTLRFYTNGTLSSSISLPSGSVLDDSGGPHELVIGAWPAETFATGQHIAIIDDVRIINGAVPYTANFTPPTRSHPRW